MFAPDVDRYPNTFLDYYNTYAMFYKAIFMLLYPHFRSIEVNFRTDRILPHCIAIKWFPRSGKQGFTSLSIKLCHHIFISIFTPDNHAAFFDAFDHKAPLFV